MTNSHATKNASNHFYFNKRKKGWSFMEFQFPYFTLFLTFFFLLIVVTILKTTKANMSTIKHPPGPWKLPLIGNMHQLVSSLPHHTLRDLAKKYGPLMHLQLGEVPTIVVSSAKVAEEVMKTNDTIFSQRSYNLAMDIMTCNFKAIICTPYGNYWRQMKKICTTELLSSNRVQSFKSIREEEVSDFIRSISSNEEGSPINLTEKLFSLAYGITARATFGKKAKGQDEFIRIVSKTLELASGFHLADMYPSSEILRRFSRLTTEMEKLHQASDSFLENIVNEYKNRKRTMQANDNEQVKENLVDVLLKIQEQPGDLEFPFTNDHIKAVIQDVFAAGSETSATVIEWAMSELLKHPDVMKKAQNEVRKVFGENGRVNEERVQELKFLRSVVKETLRLHPPTILIVRECRENCVINGYDIPAKTKVLINLWDIGRDPCYWKEAAEEFRPERFLESSIDFRGTNFEYIPFGAGRRICPGISFAIPSIELPLANLLYHFDWKLPAEMKFEDLDMTEAFGVTVRRKHALFLIPIPYSSAN